MMRTAAVLVFALLLSVVLAGKKTTWQDLKGYDFAQYVAEYNKHYSAKDYEHRKSIFDANLATILAHNSNPFSSWKMGVNHLADRSNEEFSKLLGYKRQSHSPKYEIEYIPATKTASLPPYVDWREKGVVTDVKDQGDCGSCWSFGTAETVESFNAIATGKLSVLSEQQILDCTPNPDQCGGTGGCGGGIPEIAYDMMVQMGGLASEWTYPYLSHFGTDFPCHFLANATTPVAVLKGYTKLPTNDFDSVINTLAAGGPLAINVDASAWHLYESGVFTGCNQTDSDIDHVVQLVGYGTDPTYGNYWLIRNSWTPIWGEDGYIRIFRATTEPCTIDTTPGDGTGCNGGPSTVTVCGACGILYDVSFPIIA